MNLNDTLAHVPTRRGEASDPFTGSGAYVPGYGGVEASRFTGNLIKFNSLTIDFQLKLCFDIFFNQSILISQPFIF